MRVYILIILFVCVARSFQVSFYGGSISFNLEKIAEKYIAHVELITGWELGKGPCGPGCSKKDVNTQTNARRTQKITETGNPNYFGTFFNDYKINTTNTIYPETSVRNMTDIVNANYSEWVIAVSESAKWEQELMKFSFELLHDNEDVNFHGCFWRELNNTRNICWHLQTSVYRGTRSDTGSINDCPKTYTNVYYRVKLDRVTTLQLPMIDPDGDMVKCSLGNYVNGGNLPKFPGIRVESDDQICKVTLNASRSLHYRDDFWLAIPLTFWDFNRVPIDFGGDHYLTGEYALSESNAQFSIQILEYIETPEFVLPTKRSGHRFIVYLGSTWTTDIYAKASINTTIDEFISLGRDKEQVNMSYIHDDTSRDRVKYTTMSWTPTTKDIGQHILCARVVDNTGVDSDEQRCFSVEIRDNNFNHSYPVARGKPYIIDIPSTSQLVNCELGATCLIPIYVKSNIKVAKIEISKSYTDEATIGAVDTITSSHGELLYKAILSFTHSVPGVGKICFRATDTNGASSETACISHQIEYPDPCLSSPCRNSAECISDKATGTFFCKCISIQYSGTFCEHRIDLCVPNPCLNGMCFDRKDTPYCYCNKGFEGEKCQINIDDCTPNSCNGTSGTCRDLVNSFTCDCYQRYSGSNCQFDKCEHEAPGVIECPAAGCSRNTCSGHGICSVGGVCTCRKGYDSDPKCTSKVGKYPGVTTLQFVSPSPIDRSIFTCYANSSSVMPCHLSVFVATNNGNNLSWKMEISDDLKSASSLEKEQKSSVLQGIDNVFSADVVIRGTLNDMKEQYVCVKANDRTSVAEICLELKFVDEPKQDNSQRNASVKFLASTPHEGSRFVGFINDTYTVIMYTSLSGGMCEQVVSTSEEVTVFSPILVDGSTCVTEASFAFNGTNTFDICFQSAKADFQKRCFTAKGITHDTCDTNPCVHSGHCFPDGNDSFKCICPDGYKGHMCEAGPCPVNNCQNDAYCRIHYSTQTCLCKAGYTGVQCELKSSWEMPELIFTGMVKPTLFQCIIFQPCSLSLLLTGNKDADKRPDVKAGYVSPAIKFGDIDVTQQGSSGSYQVDIGLKATEVGEKDVCIQSLDSSSVNKDEVCFKVMVIKDVSTLYGFKDRPHFIYPSLPNSANVQCADGEPCHVIYNVTPGKGNEHQCLSVVPSANNEINTSHIFTTCESCTPGRTNIVNCSVDVSIDNGINDVGSDRRFCLILSLVNSNISGEERCFNLTVVSNSTNEIKKGCQLLECRNGGFCDGHIPNQPVCQCLDGYSGVDCSHAMKTFMLEEAIHVRCTNSKWDISIDMNMIRSMYPGVTSKYIYLGQDYCVGNLENNTLKFQNNMSECHTTENISGMTRIYRNKLLCAIFDPFMPFIIRQHFWTFYVECDIKTSVTGSSHLHHGTSSHNETFVQQNNVTVELFADHNFLQPLSRGSQQIHVGDDVYVKVTTSIQDWNIKMRLHSCYTKPDRNSPSSMDVALITDGCEIASNTHIISQSTHETRFVFQDFEYRNNNEGLDVYCNATFCDYGDYSTRCSQSCNNNPPIIG